jgi:hypothetical protein
MNSVTPKAGAKHELKFNKPASVFQNSKYCKTFNDGLNSLFWSQPFEGVETRAETDFGVDDVIWRS